MSTGFEEQLADQLSDLPEETDLSSGSTDAPPSVVDDTPETPVETEETVSEETPADDAPPPVESDWSVRNAIENMGVDPSAFSSDEDAFNTLVNDWQAARQRVDEQNQVVYTLQQQMEGLQRQLAQQQPPEPDPDPTPEYKWQGAEVPQFNPEMKAFLERDEHGNIVAKPGADPMLPQQYQEYQRRREAVLDDIIRKGPDAFWAGYEPRIDNIVNERLDARIRDLETRLAKERYVEQIMPRIEDEHGQLTVYGQAYKNALEMHQDVASNHRTLLADQAGQLAELRAQLAGGEPAKPAEPRKNAGRKLRSSNTPPGTPPPTSEADSVWNSELGDLVDASNFLKSRMS